MADGGAAGTADAPPGTVVGTDPAQFASAAQLWIGMPDDKATIVVYVLSKPTSCSLLSAHGWDAKLAPGTQHLEMKEFGSGPGSFTVVTTKTPAPGEAAVNYTVNDSGNAVETSGSGGVITIASLNASKDIAGRYDLMFGSTPISGTFDATYCAGGVEP